ncbi:MAG TPA: hypothetical protein VKC90_10955 [Chitinophagaceae bacterium]|nr:hypothetical protein [Chitinophagaceae bacterium]
MNINRHNYEEYFILYMDNELGSNERRQVEDFIQKHPDLKEELDVLLQYKMVPDTSIVFNGKEELMIHDGYSPISMANYEEWLTMYIDNELTSKQRNEAEQFVAANSQVKKELELLQQTKLQPEEIFFTNKESLYRREEKVRTIPMRWWRAAVAAVLILAIGLTTAVVLNKKSPTENEVAKNHDKEQKTNKENPVIIKKEENKQVALPVITNNLQKPLEKTSKQTTGEETAKRNNVRTKEKLQNNLPVEMKKAETSIAENNQKPSNNLPQPLNNSDLKNNAFKSDITKVIPPDEIRTPQKSKVKDDVVTTNPTSTSYTGSNSDDDLNQSTAKKSKLRGFLRKVTRTFEKNTNINATDDDDRVLIGGLALKLK